MFIHYCNKKKNFCLLLFLIISFIQLYAQFYQLLNNTIFLEDENEDLGEEETSRLEDFRRKTDRSSAY